MSEPQFDPLISYSDVPSAMNEAENQNTQIKTHLAYHGETSVVAADSTHNTIEDLARQNAALQARLDKFEKKNQVTYSSALGGEPIPHHLWLVDGRVIPNHGGIGTHYSEVLDDGTTRITRVASHYVADEDSPVGQYA